jgi:hypothetical protein
MKIIELFKKIREPVIYVLLFLFVISYVTSEVYNTSQADKQTETIILLEKEIKKVNETSKMLSDFLIVWQTYRPILTDDLKLEQRMDDGTLKPILCESIFVNTMENPDGNNKK